MKLNFNVPYVMLDGKSVKDSARCPHCKKDIYEGVDDLSLGQRMANLLSGEKKVAGFPPLRSMELFMTLYKNEPIDLTVKELEAFKEYFGADDTNMPLLLKGQILKVIDALENKK